MIRKGDSKLCYTVRESGDFCVFLDKNFNCNTLILK